MRSEAVKTIIALLAVAWCVCGVRGGPTTHHSHHDTTTTLTTTTITTTTTQENINEKQESQEEIGRKKDGQDGELPPNLASRGKDAGLLTAKYDYASVKQHRDAIGGKGGGGEFVNGGNETQGGEGEDMNGRNETHTHTRTRSEYTHRNTSARILEMNQRYQGRGKLATLPWILKVESQNKNVRTRYTKDCNFDCPLAESLKPCICNPCSQSINCSGVGSLEQLYVIFHNTVFPNPRFQSFTLVSPLLKNSKRGERGGDFRSDTFFANMFGEASFSNVWVESVLSLGVVEDGAFSGSESTLQRLTFRWNYDLHYFPFAQLGNMKELQKLEISGSSYTTLPPFPYVPKLSDLFLNDNFINTIPANTFAELPSLVYLDLAFNELSHLVQGSLLFSSQVVLLFLDHNTIERLEEGTFMGHQPILLDISWNKLKSLDERVFRPILDNIINHGYDSYVDATNNPLQCINLLWLYQHPKYLEYVALPSLTCK